MTIQYAMKLFAQHNANDLLPDMKRGTTIILTACIRNTILGTKKTSGSSEKSHLRPMKNYKPFRKQMCFKNL